MLSTAIALSLALGAVDLSTVDCDKTSLVVARDRQHLSAEFDWKPVCMALKELVPALTLPPPTATPPAGSYAVGSTITLTASVAPAMIYYTTNGVTPTLASTACASPCALTLTASMNLQAIAGAAGHVPSLPVSASYLVTGDYATTTTLVSSANPSTQGQLVRLIATVSGSGSTDPTAGMMTIRDGSTIIYGPAQLESSPVVDWFSTTTLGVGSHALTATYGGTTGFAASTSPTLTQVVNISPSAPVVSLYTSGTPSSAGGLVTFTATVHGSGNTPTGTATFLDGGVVQASGPLVNGSMTWSTSSLPAGTHAIVAAYSPALGSPYAAASSSTLNQVVVGTATTTTLATSGSPSAAGQSVTLTATVVPALTVNLASSTMAIDGSQSLTATGGVAPYRWRTNQCGGVESIGAGSGVAPHLVTYRAPSLPVTCTITVTDSTAATASATVAVTGTPAGTIYYVAHSGNDSTGTGAVGAPWATLTKARTSATAGSTVYVRGTANGDTEQNCTANTGACWTAADTEGSQLHWTNGDSPTGGTSGSPISFRGYPGETVIIQPASGWSAMYFDPRIGGATNNTKCSWLVFENLIFDSRNTTYGGLKADPAGSIADAPTSGCSNVQVVNTKLRHARNTACANIFGSAWTFRNVEAYECGDSGFGTGSPVDGDHDHAYYLQGATTQILYGRVHHNVQGVQAWNTSMAAAANLVMTGVEVDHNGLNPFAPSNLQVRMGTLGDIEIFDKPGTGAVLSLLNVHDNTHYGVSLGGAFDTGHPATGVSLTNSWLWANADGNTYIGNYGGGVSSITDSTGTVSSAPSSGAGAVVSGSVAFLDGAAALGSGTLSSGVATMSTASLPVGTHSLTASYPGVGVYLASTSAVVSQVVNAGTGTITSVSVVPSTATVTGGTPQSFTAPITGTGGYSSAVLWSSTAGTWSGATWTAPAATSSVQTVTITATSVQDGSKSGTATVTVPVMGTTDVTYGVTDPVGSGFTSQDFSWPRADNERIVLVTGVAAGSASKLSYYTTATTATLPVRGVIYADNAGTPGALVGVTPEVTVPIMADGWVDLAFSSPVALSVGSYWLGLWSNTNHNPALTRNVSPTGRSLGSTYSSTGAPLASMATSVPWNYDWPITVTVATNSSTPTAATPAITPGTGTYTSAQTVTITDSTPGASILYCLGSSCTPSTTYGGSLVASTGTTVVRARATATGYNASAIAESTITVSTVTGSARMGVNVEGISWFTKNDAFNNMMTGAQNGGAAWGGAMDSNGWPTGTTDSTTLRSAAHSVAPGTYRVSFQSNAASGVAASITNCSGLSVTRSGSSAPYTYSGTCSYTTGAMALSYSGASGGISALKVLHPGSQDSDVLSPLFRSAVSHFGAIRFYQAQGVEGDGVNSSGEKFWADRRRPTYSSWCGDITSLPVINGIPYEAMILMANDVGADVWVNVPYLTVASTGTEVSGTWDQVAYTNPGNGASTDDYVTRMAQVFKCGSDGSDPWVVTPGSAASACRGGTPTYPPLGPSQHVYVEFGNELWNGSPAYARDRGWMATAAAAEYAAGNTYGYLSGNANQPAASRVGRMVMKVSDLWRAVWGDAAMGPTVRIVSGGFTGDAYSSEPLNYIASRGTVSHYVYGFAVAPYFNQHTGSAAQVVADMAADATDTSYTNDNNGGSLYRDNLRAQNFGIKMLAYEGGIGNQGADPATVCSVIRAGSAQRTQVLQPYFARWWSEPNADVFMYYDLSRADDTQGCFGLMQSIDGQSGERWQGILNVIGGNFSAP